MIKCFHAGTIGHDPRCMYKICGYVVEFCPCLENIKHYGNLIQCIIVPQFTLALGLLGLSPMAAVILLVTVALYLDSVLPPFSCEWF